MAKAMDNLNTVFNAFKAIRREKRIEEEEIARRSKPKDSDGMDGHRSYMMATFYRIQLMFVVLW